MNKLLPFLRYLGRVWLMALVASLPNDILSCRLRRAVLLRLGFDIAPDALIYRHVLLLGRVQAGAGSSTSKQFLPQWRISQHPHRLRRDDRLQLCCPLAFNHGTAWSGTPMIRQPLVEAPIVIKNDVWIGANCTVTAGVTIHCIAIVAANSVVTRDVGPNEVVGGTPARFIKHRSPAPHA